MPNVENEWTCSWSKTGSMKGLADMAASGMGWLILIDDVQ